MEKKIFIKFLKSLGIEVKINTKARGHQGIYFRNRIDISKNLDEKRAVEVIAHEFAHYIHSKIESDIFKTGGTLEKLFCVENSPQIQKELIELTHNIDKNSLFLNYKACIDKLKTEIKIQEDIIRKDFPHFKKSKNFIEFNRYTKKSDARYLLKYDVVKCVSPFLGRVKIYSVNNLDADFKQMPKAFKAYIKLKSKHRKQMRISRKIGKLKKYYEKPSELFARFIEAFFIDKKVVEIIAPTAYSRFNELLSENYYFELKEFLALI